MNNINGMLDIHKNQNTFNVADIDIKKVTDELSSHMKNKFFFNSSPYVLNHNVTIYESYEGKNLRQSFFDGCLFDNANFNKAGLSGSVFSNCTINPCNFLDTNLQSSDFRSCKFQNVVFEYTRINKSTFYDTVFNNCIFKSVSLNDAIFDKCEFNDCEWIPISIENAVFRNTTLNKTKIKDMNFEFCTFENIKTINMKLPFPTLPFIFNGLKYLSETTDNIRVTSAGTEAGISAKEYLTNIPNLEKFYTYTQNFFPLSNIFIVQEKYEEALKAVSFGIGLAIDIRSFRLIKYYCKQLNYIKNVTMHTRQGIYNDILSKLSTLTLEDFEKDSLNLYLPEVRSLLLTVQTKSAFQISIQTNIQSNEYDKLSALLSVFDKLISEKGNYSVEIRHNSPFECFFEIFADPQIATLLVTAVGVIIPLINCWRNERIKAKEAKLYEEDVKTLQKLNIKINQFTIINNGNIKTISN